MFRKLSAKETLIMVIYASIRTGQKHHEAESNTVFDMAHSLIDEVMADEDTAPLTDLIRAEEAK